jgi:hypothetical protein
VPLTRTRIAHGERLDCHSSRTEDAAACWSDRGSWSFRAGQRRLGRPPVRVRRPVRPNIGSDQAARCADHSGTQGPHRGLVRQPVGIDECAMAAPNRLAIDKKIAAAVPANVTERNGLESLVVAWDHVANKSGAPPAALGMVGSGSINVASSSLARELFTLFDTGHFCNTSFAAGLSTSMPALPVSQGSN